MKAATTPSGRPTPAPSSGKPSPDDILYPVTRRQLAFSIPITLMLKGEGTISEVLIEKLIVWHHSSFPVDMTLPLIGPGHSAA